MASLRDSAYFFKNGTSKQFEYCLKIYPTTLKLKANKKCKKPDELVRLDDWYQSDLPKTIQKRGKDAHMVHEELVQTMKWKQTRGKFFPQLSFLIKVNTPRAVMAETKKAFKKLPNLEQALTALSNLKGVGVTMASALLAAACPDHAPFMADECLMAIPEIEGIDYTTKEYLNFVQHIQQAVQRLNSESQFVWNPHRLELALWAHYVASDLSPELLDDMPNCSGAQSPKITSTTNGRSLVEDEDTNTIEDNSVSNDSSSQEDNTRTTEAAEVETDDTTDATLPLPVLDDQSNDSNQPSQSNGNHVKIVADSFDEESTRSGRSDADDDSNSNMSPLAKKIEIIPKTTANATVRVTADGLNGNKRHHGDSLDSSEDDLTTAAIFTVADDSQDSSVAVSVVSAEPVAKKIKSSTD